MKNLLLSIILFAWYAKANSQTDCNCDFKTTFGLHYDYVNGTNGLGLEYGKSGDESPFNIHVGFDMFFRRSISTNKSKVNGDTVMTGRMYNKIGYRLLRIPYQLSIYADAFGGLDMNLGIFYGFGIKFLRPFNENAISIEPIYIPGKKSQLSLQAAFHFKL